MAGQKFKQSAVVVAAYFVLSPNYPDLQAGVKGNDLDRIITELLHRIVDPIDQAVSEISDSHIEMRGIIPPTWLICGETGQAARKISALSQLLGLPMKSEQFIADHNPPPFSITERRDGTMTLFCKLEWLGLYSRSPAGPRGGNKNEQTSYSRISCSSRIPRVGFRGSNAA